MPSSPIPASVYGVVAVLVVGHLLALAFWVRKALEKPKPGFRQKMT